MTEMKVVSLDQSELSSYFRCHLLDQSEDSILTWQLDIPHLLSLVMSSLSLTLSTMIRWRHMITPQPCPHLIIVLNSETVFLKLELDSTMSQS